MVRAIIRRFINENIDESLIEIFKEVFKKNLFATYVTVAMSSESNFRKIENLEFLRILLYMRVHAVHEI